VPADARRRILLILPAGLSLVAAIDAGLFRIGWPFPLPQPDLPLAHGPLMVCGFLGTLIGLEKAVALGKTWAYLGVAATAAGGVGLIVATHATLPRLLFLVGSLGFVSVSATFLARHRTAANAFVLAGALLWSVANALFLLAWPISPWCRRGWVFLLTVAGERLAQPPPEPSRSSRFAFFVAVASVVGAILLAGIAFARGEASSSSRAETASTRRASITPCGFSDSPAPRPASGSSRTTWPGSRGRDPASRDSWR
jgi:hypothetical protein